MSWKTHCVGRVMMSLPEDRKLTWSAGFDGADVSRLQPMSKQEFWDGVEVVRQRYLAQKHDKAPSRLAHFEKVGENAVFVAYYDNEVSYRGPNLERYVYLDRDHAYQMLTGSLSTGNVAPSPGVFKPFVDKYTPILNRIHFLALGQLPSRDGLCVDGAVVSGETGMNSRAALVSEIAFGTKLGVGYLENNYKIALYSGFEDVELDQERSKLRAPDKGPGGFKEFKMLRKRERALDGLAGQEFIARTTLNSGHVFYRMQWTIKGALDGGVLKPAIQIHLNTPDVLSDAYHKPYDKLPPEPELINLWDYALSTFRWRDGALLDGQKIQGVN